MRCATTTTTGSRCGNPVAPGSRACAAGHLQPAGRPTTSAGRQPDVAAAAAAVPFSRPAVDPSLLTGHPALEEIIDRFDAAGLPLHAVGGPVRDLHELGTPGEDLDLCTPADPDQVAALVDDLGAVPDVGREFGTVKLFRDGMPTVEITRWRTDAYRSGSRKPQVAAAGTLVDDLARRDFTVNAMALDLHTGALADPFGGRADLAAGRLRPPGDADVAFADDPLRTVRMVRFAATRGWQPDRATAAAAARQAGRLDIVARERILAELGKVLDSSRPDALGDAVRSARQAGVDGRLFGRLDAARTAGFGPLPPQVRLAALAYATGDAARPALKGLMVPNAAASTAVAVAGCTTAAAAVDGPVAARRLVRTTSDEVLADAWTLSGRVGVAWPPQLVAAVAERDRWRGPLPVDGRDGLAAGLKGPQVGSWLGRVEDRWLAGSLSREGALALV